MSNYNDTLNILKTNFEMKANLPIKEPLIQKRWVDKEIYQKMLASRDRKHQKVVHDGPPYANGPMHFGHAMNRTLKDILTRRWFLEGYWSHFIPGWDTHGMPIEIQLIKKGVNVDKNIPIHEKRDNCRNFALAEIELQKKAQIRLGTVSDFKDIYKTLDPDFEVEEIKVFFNALENNLAHRDLKPVFWSWSSQTSLAEAELEYGDVEGNSIYLTFEVVEGNNFIKKGDKMVVWTTTPWTLPSNQAIAVNPNFNYYRLEIDENTHYIILDSRFEDLKDELNIPHAHIVEKISGKDMEHIKYVHPLYNNLISPVILADYVTNQGGSGLVHNASGFGKEDYIACKKYGIKPYAPIGADGKFTDECHDKTLVGKFYESTNDEIIQRLKIANCLLKADKITHSVALDWRTKKPIMFRATKQWFIDIDKLKSKMIENCENVNYPNIINKEQLISSIGGRDEWCISRQRYWGVPITVIYDENENTLMDIELNKKIIDIISKEGTNAWFYKPVEYFLTEKYLNTGKKYRKETDILDVWFDSGTTWSIFKKYGIETPCEVYLEGKDQFRGWFNSSMILGTIGGINSPYKRLLGCGFVNDENGVKMSKSIGNVIDPMDIFNQYGADILRLSVATANYKNDAKFGKTIFVQVSEMYRRIRNTLFKFILSNISDFDPNKNWNTNYSEIDNLVVSDLVKNLRIIDEAYNNFDFTDVVNTTLNHVSSLSGWYFDIIKDTLYCDEANDPKRRAIQTVLYQILFGYLLSLAPIMPHTAEEVYDNFNCPNKKESLFLEINKECFNLDNIEYKKVDSEKWTQFFKIKDQVFAVLEKLKAEKKINKNTQALVAITFNNKHNFSDQDLAKYLNVAKVIINNSDNEEILVKAENANLVRCERCWNYYDANILDGDLCPRCAKIIKK